MKEIKLCFNSCQKKCLDQLIITIKNHKGGRRMIVYTTPNGPLLTEQLIERLDRTDSTDNSLIDFLLNNGCEPGRPFFAFYFNKN